MPEVNRRMETQAAFVGTDRAVHLNAEPAVYVQLALIVLPGDAEDDHALRLDDPLDDLRFAILRMLIQDECERLDDFLDGLVKLGFRRVFGLNVGHQRCNFVIHGSRTVCQTASGNRSKIRAAPPPRCASFLARKPCLNSARFDLLRGVLLDELVLHYPDFLKRRSHAFL